MWIQGNVSPVAAVDVTRGTFSHDALLLEALPEALADFDVALPFAQPASETSLRSRFSILVEVLDAELARLVLAKRKKDVEEEEEFDDEEEEDDDLEDEEDDEDDEFDDEEDEFEEEFEDDDLDDDDDDIFYDDDDDD